MTIMDRSILIKGDIIAIHPGKHIKDYLEDEEMSQTEFSKRMDISKGQVTKLINGEVDLTENMITRLSDVTGISKEYWRHLNNIYLEKKYEINNYEKIEEEKKIAREIDYSFWTKLGILSSSSKAIDKVKNLRKYLNVSSLETLKKPDLLTQYRKTTNKAQEKNIVSINAWIQTAINLSKEDQVSEINLEYLLKKLPEIKAMTTSDPKVFLPKLKQIFSDSGVKFIFLPYLKNSELNGAVKWVNHSENVLLMMNNKQKASDVFWFSLFHEIRHVFQEKKKRIIITPSMKKMINGKENERLEKDADDFARKILIDESEYKEFLAMGTINQKSIIKFAQDEGVHPGIVVGRLQNDGHIGHDQYNSLKVKYVFKLINQ